MAKTIVIQSPSWLERHPVQIRRLLVRLIFSEATQYGWQVRMHGARWDADSRPAKQHKTYPPMTDEEWAHIMGNTAA